MRPLASQPTVAQGHDYMHSPRLAADTQATLIVLGKAEVITADDVSQPVPSKPEATYKPPSAQQIDQ